MVSSVTTSWAVRAQVVSNPIFRRFRDMSGGSGWNNSALFSVGGFAPSIKAMDETDTSSAAGIQHLVQLCRCRACGELLHLPLSLPCGHAICARCFRPPATSSLATYVCPVKTCARRHLCRGERPNVLLASLLDLVFPAEMEALVLCKQGEVLLKPYWSNTQPVCRDVQNVLVI